MGLPWWLRWWRICLKFGRPGFDPWVGKIPWRRAWQPAPVFLPGESHGQRSLAGYSPWCPWSHKESDMPEQLSKQHRYEECHSSLWFYLSTFCILGGLFLPQEGSAVFFMTFNSGVTLSYRDLYPEITHKFPNSALIHLAFPLQIKFFFSNNDIKQKLVFPQRCRETQKDIYYMIPLIGNI